MKIFDQFLFKNKQILMLSVFSIMFGLTQVIAQCPTIEPDGVYNPKDDILMTSYHQTISKTPTGLITWGEDMDSDGSWTFDYAYSVDLDPSRGGEHVQAGFTGTIVKDGVESKKSYHESYYIIEGKIVFWTQRSMAVNEE